MGRYTQRRRAASGPSPAAAAVVPQILDVDCDGMGPAIVTFSAPVVVDAGPSPDTAFDINSQTPISAASIDATHVSLGFNIAPNAGATWTLASQPNWLTTIVVSPDTGTTT